LIGDEVTKNAMVMAYGTHGAVEGERSIKGFGGKRRPRLMSKDNIKRDFEEVSLDSVDSLSEDSNNWRALDNNNRRLVYETFGGHLA
jgi:hypothetical protein